jgi:hypothetical protein
MQYGCPNGHTDGIEQGCRLTVWLPVNPDTGETDTDILDGRETDNWEHAMTEMAPGYTTVGSTLVRCLFAISRRTDL